ncbi:hypothetical protein H072_10440 [Dactylellina haptotyla CBS 200.50]|uniref:Transcription and mRNA export factor SUS1 n=1 Tax=Dactylellina haptotyla (strain CBS 200.50) TaxID=1284197 RepID=S8BL73_DACHA|nr:hypothetical protein H072_10440 [Dactylellina haptotyla CBS 200.50]
MAPQVPLQTQVNLKLVERGQRQRLLDHLIEQLHISGWYEDTRRAASRAIYAHQNGQDQGGQQAPATDANGEPISDFHQVLHQVEEEMWGKVPVEVQREMYQRISAVLEGILKK